MFDILLGSRQGCLLRWPSSLPFFIAASMLVIILVETAYVVEIDSHGKDDTLEEIKVENTTEMTSVESYGEVKSAKKTEISTLLNQFERKMKLDRPPKYLLIFVGLKLISEASKTKKIFAELWSQEAKEEHRGEEAGGREHEARAW